MPCPQLPGLPSHTLRPSPENRPPALTSSRRFCQRPHGDSSRISDSSSLSSSSSSSGGAAEATGADTEVIPGPDDAGSGFESEPPLGTCLDSPSDMPQPHTLRAGRAVSRAEAAAAPGRVALGRAGPGESDRAAPAGPVSRGRAPSLPEAPGPRRLRPERGAARAGGRGALTYRARPAPPGPQASLRRRRAAANRRAA